MKQWAIQKPAALTYEHLGVQLWYTLMVLFEVDKFFIELLSAYLQKGSIYSLFVPLAVVLTNL